MDLTNRLLARTGETLDSTTTTVRPPHAPPKILLADTSATYAEEFDEAIEFDFQLPQTFPDDQESLLQGEKYGFNNQYSGCFRDLQGGEEVVTCFEPEGKTRLERWEVMRKQEDEKFDREWYLADKLDPPDELVEILAYNPPLNDEPFTPEEQSQLQNLGNRDCIPPILG